MIEAFDGGSVAATSRFIAEGSQPFACAADLASIEVSTLVIPGDDLLHPADVSDLYAANITRCTVASPSTTDLAEVIGAFADACVSATT